MLIGQAYGRPHPLLESRGVSGHDGLETDTLNGWLDRRPFYEASRELVWVTRKRG